MTMLQNKGPTCRVKPDAAGFTGVRTGAKRKPIPVNPVAEGFAEHKDSC